MRREQRRLLNIVAFSLLGFAIYLNFFKTESPDFLPQPKTNEIIAVKAIPGNLVTPIKTDRKKN